MGVGMPARVENGRGPQNPVEPKSHPPVVGFAQEQNRGVALPTKSMGAQGTTGWVSEPGAVLWQGCLNSRNVGSIPTASNKCLDDKKLIFEEKFAGDALKCGEARSAPLPPSRPSAACLPCQHPCLSKPTPYPLGSAHCFKLCLPLLCKCMHNGARRAKRVSKTRIVGYA